MKGIIETSMVTTAVLQFKSAFPTSETHQILFRLLLPQNSPKFNEIKHIILAFYSRIKPTHLIDSKPQRVVCFALLQKNRRPQAQAGLRSDVVMSKARC